MQEKRRGTILVGSRQQPRTDSAIWTQPIEKISGQQFIHQQQAPHAANKFVRKVNHKTRLGTEHTLSNRQRASVDF